MQTLTTRLTEYTTMLHCPHRRIHHHRLLRTEAVQIVWPAGFGPGATQALAAKRLHGHHRANNVAVDVDVVWIGHSGARLGPAVVADILNVWGAIRLAMVLVAVKTGFSWASSTSDLYLSLWMCFWKLARALHGAGYS